MEGNTFVNTVTSSVVRFKCFVFGLSSLLLFGLLLLLLFSPHFQVLICLQCVYLCIISASVNILYHCLYLWS